ncbi:STAS domain-containing protein [Saccharothrix longispora]|uniref:STAS domain-containing protein n=1 Tax=Saccharothrix longispora TaxID=33920 RepID=UPI0028FD0B6E|nr:STAS domain-containing protein [Saccharothrix longispora]MDU0287832.1 STAS domain-containing protein [Saccharothrix longispora]
MVEPIEHPSPALDVDVVRVDGVVIVTVAGELDLDTAPRLRDVLLGPPPPVLVLDLTAVRFFGSSGLSLLLEANRHARCAGGELVLVAAGRVVLRPLEITGVVRVLTLFPTLAEALTWKSAARVGQPA